MDPHDTPHPSARQFQRKIPDRAEVIAYLQRQVNTGKALDGQYETLVTLIAHEKAIATDQVPLGPPVAGPTTNDVLHHERLVHWEFSWTLAYQHLTSLFVD